MMRFLMLSSESANKTAKPLQGIEKGTAKQLNNVCVVGGKKTGKKLGFSPESGATES